MPEKISIDDLDQESTAWLREALITNDQRTRMLARYEGFSAAPRHQKLNTTIATLGAILVGFGIILFFASNWQTISPIRKLVLLLISMLACYGISEYLNRRDFPRLGASIGFLGSILFGANIFLMAQAYNINAHWPSGVLWWSIGIIPLAFLLSSHAIGTLALAAFSFWIGSELSQSIVLYSSLTPYCLVYGFWGACSFGIGLYLSRTGTQARLSLPFQWFGLFFILSSLFMWTFSHEGTAAKIFLSDTFDGKKTCLVYSTVFSAVGLISLGGVVLRRPTRSDIFIGIWTILAIGWAWAAMSYLPPFAKQTAYLANILYFVEILALLYIGYLTQRGYYVNFGLLGFAAMVIARYFDFAWKYMERATAFIVGGVLLLLLGFAMERGRRKLLRRDSVL